MKQPTNFRVCWAVTSTVLLFFLTTVVFSQFDPDLFSGMKARSIGPAEMSGRIGDIQAVLSNPDIIYLGAATGGLWKSTSGSYEGEH